MTGYILGIDAGTSMVKSVLFDRAGNEVAVSRQKTVVATPQPGWNEQDMDEVWQAVVKPSGACWQKGGPGRKTLWPWGLRARGTAAG